MRHIILGRRQADLQGRLLIMAWQLSQHEAPQRIAQLQRMLSARGSIAVSAWRLLTAI